MYAVLFLANIAYSRIKHWNCKQSTVLPDESSTTVMFLYYVNYQGFMFLPPSFSTPFTSLYFAHPLMIFL
jgi:hypothetical protein